MASRRTPSHNPKINIPVQQPYRVVAFKRGKKILSDRFLYTKDLAQMQLIPT